MRGIGLDRKTYHHGNLHETLLEEGMALIHEEGMAQFSLRKLAKRVGVSPTACYNHFYNIEDLLSAITDYIDRRFTDAIQKGIEKSLSNPKNLMIELGKEYVAFFAENPFYFSYIFETNDKEIVLTDTDFTGNYAPFLLFRNAAFQVMQQANIPEEHYCTNIIAMWAMVHGLAAMANMKAFHYDGDWRALTEKILLEKLNIC